MVVGVICIVPYTRYKISLRIHNRLVVMNITNASTDVNPHHLHTYHIISTLPHTEQTTSPYPSPLSPKKPLSPAPSPSSASPTTKPRPHSRITYHTTTSKAVKPLHLSPLASPGMSHSCTPEIAENLRGLLVLVEGFLSGG